MAPSRWLDLSLLRSRAALKRIAVVTLACAVLGAVYAALAPRWYRSVLTVVPAKSQRGGAGPGSLAGGGGASVVAAAFLDGSPGGADPARIAVVLQSVAVTDAVIEKFDLRRRYGEASRETTRDALWRRCFVNVLPRPGLVQLSCEDKDPEFVQRVLEYFAECGNQAFRRVGASSASEEVRFFEGRVAELRRQAEEAAARMSELQERYRIVDLDAQAKAVLSSLATLDRQRTLMQLELDYARTFSSSDEPTMRQLESQLGVMQRKLLDLERPVAVPPAPAGARSRRARDETSEMFPAALEVPKIRGDFERLYRDRMVAEATLVVALERLEGAKADEARDVSAFVVLDPPTLPTRQSRPRPFGVVSMVSVLGLAAALVRESRRRKITPAALP